MSSEFTGVLVNFRAVFLLVANSSTVSGNISALLLDVSAGFEVTDYLFDNTCI